MTDVEPPLAPSRTRRNGNRAFMLIELAVASFVVGACLLALLAVARSGQRAALDGESETRATLFAQDAFTTLRLFSDRAATDEDPSAWTNFWIDLATGGAVTQFPGFVAGDRPYRWTEEEGPPSLYGDGEIRTNLWSSEKSAPEALPGNAVQYRMTISTPGGAGDGFQSFNQVQVTLHVWAGLTRVKPETYTFFAIFSNQGRLP